MQLQHGDGATADGTGRPDQPDDLKQGHGQLASWLAEDDASDQTNSTAAKTMYVLKTPLAHIRFSYRSRN